MAPSPDQHLAFMREAMHEAEAAFAREEVPIGAVIVNPATGAIIARAGNETEALNDPTAHAEILAIRRACSILGSPRVPGLDLYVTLEPCTACAAAISFARIRTVYYGAADPKGGGVLHGATFYTQPTCHHRPTTEQGLLAQESSELLKKFFTLRRK